MSYIDVFEKDLGSFVEQFKKDQAALSNSQNRIEKLRSDIADYERTLSVVKTDLDRKREELSRACDGREETLRQREIVIETRTKDAETRFSEANGLRETWTLRNGELDARKADLDNREADISRRLSIIASAAK